MRESPTASLGRSIEQNNAFSQLNHQPNVEVSLFSQPSLSNREPTERRDQRISSHNLSSSSEVEFKNSTVDKEDVATLPRATASIFFANCKSKQWQQIGKMLVAFPELTTIDMQQCDSTDKLCTAIYTSKTIKKLRMSIWKVTQRTAV